MQFSAKLVAYLLLATVIALPAAAQMPVAAPSPPSTGCDDHGGPTPSPLNYICCQAGHDTAALQDSFSLPDLVSHFISSPDFDASAPPSPAVNGSPVSLVADSPPLLISLRI